MTNVSRRIARRATREFGRDADSVTELLATMRLMGSVDHERVHAAVLIAGDGHLERLIDAIALAEADWRDVLVNGGLANGDWALKLDVELGSADD